jgi:hypothetical protein
VNTSTYSTSITTTTGMQSVLALLSLAAAAIHFAVMRAHFAVHGVRHLLLRGRLATMRSPPSPSPDGLDARHASPPTARSLPQFFKRWLRWALAPSASSPTRMPPKLGALRGLKKALRVAASHYAE